MSEFFEQPIEEEIPYDNVVEVVPFEETPEEIDVDLVLDFTAKLIPYVDKAITVVEESEEETSPEYQELIDEIKRLKGDMETVQINLGGMAESSETYNDLMAEGAQLNWEMTRAMENASIEIGNLGQQAADLWAEVALATGYASDAALAAANAHNEAVEAEQKAEAARLAAIEAERAAAAAEASAAAAIKDSVVQYATGASETVAPVTGWSTATPTRTTGTFIWMRTVITYGNNDTSTSSPALLTGPAGAGGSQGIPGPPGNDGQSGTTTYTWLKYADSPTTGISDSPTGKTYMGLAYNKTTATESNAYADYSWSLIKGTDGVRGPDGQDGATLYTWIKYGTSAAGAGISDLPAGKTYIGVAYNKPTATESNTPGDYEWSLIQGPQGNAGKGISGTPAVTYQKHTNGVTAPTGTWTTTVPTVAPGEFLWTRTITNYTDSTSTTAYSVSAAGTNGSNGTAGPAGTDGQTSYIHVAYSNDATGSTGFSTTDPTGKTYMGTYTNFLEADSTTPGDYEWVLIKGSDGSTGTTGKGISSSVVAYQVSTSGTATPTGAWLTPVPTVPEGQFLWTRTTLNFTDGASTLSYSVAKQGISAPNIALTATSQVLVSPPGGGATSPTTAVVTGVALNTTIDKWEYSVNGAAFTTSLPTGVTRSGNAVTITGTTLPLGSATVTVKMSNVASGTSDTLTVAQVFNGAAGASGSSGTEGVDAYTVLLTNESHVFPGGISAATAGNTITGLIVYKGATRIPATISGVTGQVTGLTTAITSNGTVNAGVTVTVSATPALTAVNGVLTLTFTADSKTFTKDMSWSVSRTGATGTTGATGVSVTSIVPYFRRSVAQPADPPSGWTTTEPAAVSGSFLWRSDQVTYSNSTVVYTPVTKVASDAFAQEAWDKAEAANNNAISRGTDLVTNGTGLLGNNTNFTWATYTKADAPTGITGSFVDEQGDNRSQFSSEIIPVDPSKSYVESVWVRQTLPNFNSRFYVGLAPYDAAGGSVSVQSYAYKADTVTTLAQPLTSGDTTVTLTEYKGAWDFSNSYLGIWDWTDSFGKVWPVGTYTRNSPRVASASGNVVTFTAPYVGPTIPAGNPVSRNLAGGSYMYAAASNQIAPQEWTQFKSLPIGGIHDGSTGSAAVRSFPPGTAGVKILLLTNRPNSQTTGGKQAFAGFSFSDASAAQAAADNAQAGVNAALKASVNEYAVNTSETVAPTTGWSESTPTRTAGSFIWFRTKITRGDNTTSTTNPALLTGNAGATGDKGDKGNTGNTGATGVSVTKVTPFFNQRTTSSGAPNQPTGTGTPSGWSTSEPSYLVNTTLWRAERVDYSNSTSSWTTPTAVTAYTIAGEAIASANGKNTRNTSLSPTMDPNDPLANPPTATANLNGRPLVEGDTWWRVNNWTERVVTGQWTWTVTGGVGAWKADKIGTEVIANLDVSKLTATLASMQLATAQKMAVDFGAFKVLTTDKLAVVSTDGGVYPDPMFLDPGLSALRATNTSGISFVPGTNSMSGTGNMWLTREAMDEGKTIPLVKGERYTVRVWGTGLTATNGRKFSVKDDAGYAIVEATYFTGGMSLVVQPAGNDARVQIWRTSGGTATHTITRVEIRQGIGGTLIENGAVTTDKVFAGAIGTDQLAANAVTATKMAVGDLSNHATINHAVPGSISYGTEGVDLWTDGVLTSGYGGDPWSIRVPESTSSPYFMFRPNTGPVPIQTGDQFRMTFEAYCSSGTQTFSANVWTYPSKSGSSFSMTPVAGSPATILTTTPQKFTVEGTALSGVEGATSFLVGLTGLSSTAVPRVRNVRMYRKGAGELVVDGSISGNAITGGQISGVDIYSPDAASTPRVHIGGSQIEVVRSSESEEYKSVQLGGASADKLALYGTDGVARTEFDSDGNGRIEGTMDANKYKINGNDLITEYIDPKPQGILTHWRNITPGDKTAGGVLGICALGAKLYAGRTYRVHYHGAFKGTQATSDTMWLRVKVNQGTVDINSSNVAGVLLPSRDNWFTGAIETLYTPTTTGGYNFLVTFQRHSGIGILERYGSSTVPSEAWLEDLGSFGGGANSTTQGGGVPYEAGTAPAPTTQSFVRTYTSIGNRSWRGGSAISGELGHGTYSGLYRASMVGFDGTDIVEDLTNATITKVEIKLKNIHTWAGSGMTAYIGSSNTVTTNSVPSSVSTASTTQAIAWGKNETKWVTVPTSFWTKDHRSFVIGVGAPVGNTYYGKFSTALADSQLRVSYTKTI